MVTSHGWDPSLRSPPAPAGRRFRALRSNCLRYFHPNFLSRGARSKQNRPQRPKRKRFQSRREATNHRGYGTARPYSFFFFGSMLLSTSSVLERSSLQALFFEPSQLPVFVLNAGGLVAQDRQGKAIVVSGLCVTDLGLRLLELRLA
jgi:hypothetical protein